jgi:adenosylmethionine---8-amino-7-oxononanoate aminotransferase
MSDRTDHLLELDRRHVWHPFTQMSEWVSGRPLVIEGGDGNYLIDTEGNRYLDGVSSLWVTVHGHRRREIDDAIRAQLDRIGHSTLLGLASGPSAELAAKLAAVAPGELDKVFYSDSGSTAVEIGLKIAYQYQQHRGRTGKVRFAALAEAYHGDTLGAVSVGGIDLFHSIFRPLLFDNHRVPTPSPRRHPGCSPEQARDRALAALAETLERHGHEIAALVMEPLVQGAAGMLVHPRGYLAEAARLCREHDVLLVLDEVATGFGRTGTMFACEQEGVTPDLLCVAKGITGGYLPLAATLATNEVYEAFLAPRVEGKQFFHGHTYTGNPLACAAAIASLELFQTDRTLDRVKARAERLEALLREHLQPLAPVAEIRQRGLMVGVELARGGSLDTPYPAADLAGARVCDRARDHGVILRPLGDVVVLMPPLSVTDADLDLLVSAVRGAITDVLA